MSRPRNVALAVAVVLGALASLPTAAPADEAPHHEMGCAEDHPRVVELRNQVREVLSSTYRNLPQVLAAGYIPYFDAVVPYGNTTPYPNGTETGIPYLERGYPDPQTWVKHYVQPWWMDDGDNMNPLRPESLLLDEWDRPIGMMFIADIDTEGEALYVNEDGTPCHPWHEHVDDAALYAFWGYRYFFKGNAEQPSETPPMMHVWVSNSAGTFAHEYPKVEEREGPPPPLPWSCTPTMEEGPAGPICG